MGIVTFGTEEEWKAWRMTGIGGSDAPVIAGVSRFKRPFDLWMEKTGKRPPPKTTEAMKHGLDNEARARDVYTLAYSAFLPPANLASDDSERPWLHASLDGFDPDVGLVLEIKCPF